MVKEKGNPALRQSDAKGKRYFGTSVRRAECQHKVHNKVTRIQNSCCLNHSEDYGFFRGSPYLESEGGYGGNVPRSDAIGNGVYP